ncbi:hypothetical protein [Streptomyces sp. BK340]|nr:hypothetical protein [Streptomyces sp. BK340]TVZ90370.1 hypothetical protein FB157_11127 [Streptomyces sp. BK340]
MAFQPEQLDQADQLSDDELDTVAGGDENAQISIYEDGCSYVRADLSQI